MQDIEISIDQLMPDFKNPRIGHANTRLEALSRIVELQGERVVKLAADIAENGLSPIERMFVIEEEAFPDHYVVAEGNRRASALILLNNPNLVQSMDVFKSTPVLEKIGKRLERVARRFDRELVEPLKVVFAPSRADTGHWIRIRHGGQQGGIGVTPWSHIESSRFNDDEAPIVVAADFLLQHGGLSDVELELLRDIPWTTFDRFLESPKTREMLGLSLKSGKLLSHVINDEVAKGLRNLAFKVANGEFNSRRQNTVEQRMEALQSMGKDALPDLTKSIRPTKLSELSKGAEQQPAPKTRPKKRPKPDPKNRDKLFKASDFNVADNRAHGVFAELYTLSVKKHPNACAVLLRVLLELSLLHYANQNAVGVTGKGGHQAELHLLVDRVYSRMKELNSDLELGAIESIVQAKTSKGWVRILHEYVHSRHIFPSHSDLIAMADELTPFFEEIWKNDD